MQSGALSPRLKRGLIIGLGALALILLIIGALSPEASAGAAVIIGALSRHERERQRLAELRAETARELAEERAEQAEREANEARERAESEAETWLDRPF
jgi:hypothetical protein